MHNGVVGQYGQLAVKRVVMVSKYAVEDAELATVSAMAQVFCLQTAILAKNAHKQFQQHHQQQQVQLSHQVHQYLQSIWRKNVNQILR